MIKCPKCNWPLDEDERFCSQCGAEMPNAQESADEAPLQKEEPNADEKTEKISAGKLSAQGDQSDWAGDIEQKVNSALEEAGKKDVPTDQDFWDKEIDHSAPMQEPDHAQKKSPAKKSKCKDLHVEYNTRRIFVDGYSIPFEFRITPLEEGVDDICITMRLHNKRTRDTYIDRVKDPFIVAKGQEDELNMDFFPPEGLHGKLTFNFFISYRKNDTQYWYRPEETPKHNIFPQKIRAQKAVDSIKIDLRNMIGTVDHAADVNINQRLDKLKDVMRGLAPEDSANELINIDLPSVWLPLPLKPCSPPELTKPPQARQRPHRTTSIFPSQARKQRLTIRYDDGKLLHLLSGDRIKVGKNRERSDIVARNFLPDLSGFDRENCRMISKEHLVFERQSGQCLIRDSSKNGVYLEENRMMLSKVERIPLNKSLDLSLAAKSTDPHSLGFQLYAWQCKPEIRSDCQLFDCREGTPACVLIKRRDNVPETFVWLFGCCPLKQIDTRFDDALVWRQDDGFVLWNNGRGTWLEPGRNLSIKENAVCREYEQYGMG